MHVAATGFHVGTIAMLQASVGGEARVDSLGTFEAVVSPGSIITAVPESQRSRDWPSVPLVAMPASVHPEHAVAMPHPPAIRSMVPCPTEVDGIVIQLAFVRGIAGAGCIDERYADADRHVHSCHRTGRNHCCRAGE